MARIIVRASDELAAWLRAAAASRQTTVTSMLLDSYRKQMEVEKAAADVPRARRRIPAK